MVSRRQLSDHFRKLEATVAKSSEGFERRAIKLAQAFLEAESEDVRAPYREALVAEAFARIDRYRSAIFLFMDDWYYLTGGVDGIDHEDYPIEYVEDHVRYAAKALFETGDVAAFVDELKKYIGRVVNDAKFE